MNAYDMNVVHISGDRLVPDTPADDFDYDACCLGSAGRGRSCCTCWTEVLNLVAQEPQEPGPPQVRSTPCHDCACRLTSPERTDRDDMASSWDGVLRSAGKGLPFYCHDGMPVVVARVHDPTGNRFEVAPEDRHGYRPRLDSRGCPVRADGSPALLCAGWAALAQAEGHDWFLRGELAPTDR